MFIGIPYYDVFVYLNNALIFAGVPVGNMSVIYLSPLMPLLTSLVFKAGYISENVIFILDGIIFIFGIMGLYLLFRERFNEIQSFTGCLIFLSFPPNIRLGSFWRYRCSRSFLFDLDHLSAGHGCKKR